MFDEKSYSLKWTKPLRSSQRNSSLRTGHVASMLDLIKVDVYGQQMPINKLEALLLLSLE